MRSEFFLKEWGPFLQSGFRRCDGCAVTFEGWLRKCTKLFLKKVYNICSVYLPSSFRVTLGDKFKHRRSGEEKVYVILASLISVSCSWCFHDHTGAVKFQSRRSTIRVNSGIQLSWALLLSIFYAFPAAISMPSFCILRKICKDIFLYSDLAFIRETHFCTGPCIWKRVHISVTQIRPNCFSRLGMTSALPVQSSLQTLFRWI